MVAVTASGSVYEIDEAQKRVRRLKGAKDPTPRQGADGEWKEYSDINVCSNGSLLIVWGSYLKDNEVVLRSTQTSPVTLILENVEQLPPGTN